MNPSNYVPLHVHTMYSLQDGYSKIPDLVKTVKDMGLTACAITDHGTMSGVVPFYNECLRQGIKPIVGIEAYFTPDITVQDRKMTYHLILLAKDFTGYRNLMKIDTYAHSHTYYKPRVDMDILEQYKEGIICTSACMGGILNTNHNTAVEWIGRFKEVFGDNYYLEIQSNTVQEQVEYNKHIVRLSMETKVPVIVTTDAHYSKESDAKYHRLWIEVNKGGHDYYPTNEFYIQSCNEIREKLPYLKEKYVNKLFENTVSIANECNLTIEITGNHYPVYPVDDPLAAVKDLCRKGWKQKVLGKTLKNPLSVYKDRLKREIRDLTECHYLNYLLIVQDMLNWCKDNNILTGIGRGSVGGCLTAYLMGITNIDPMEHGLLFERFCNRERITPADVDSDVEDTHRQDLIDHLEEQYGKVYNVRTFNFYGVRGSVAAAGRALGYPAKLVSKLKVDLSYDELDDYIEAAPLTTKLKCFHNGMSNKDVNKLQEKKELVRTSDAPLEGLLSVKEGLHYKAPEPEHLTKCMLRMLKDVAEKFYGLLASYGTHASAIMVFNDDPTNYCPIEVQKKIPVASYDYHILEGYGLLKLDILGLRNLSIVHDTLDMIDDDIDIYHLPLDDKGVYEQYAEGNTTGIFQCESTGMRAFAKSMHVSCFDDVAALVALYRPGPLDSGMAQQYIDGKNGAAVVALHPALEKVLGNTYQVIVYQEELMQVSRVLAGFSMGEADKLRKVVGRKELTKDEHGKTPVDYAVGEFVERAEQRGVEKDVAEELGRQMTACGRYIFNKSHACSYGMTSYLTAYLKYHYPKEYMCALLNSVIGDIDKTVDYIKECERMGITVALPCFKYRNARYEIHDGVIYYALTAIKGVGSNMDTSCKDQFYDILAHNHKGVTAALVQAGALDYLGLKREDMFGALSSSVTAMKRIEQCKEKIGQYTEKGDSKRVAQWTEKLELAKGELERMETDQGYDYAAGEINVLGWTNRAVPKVKSGTIKKVYKKRDRRDREMAWITFTSNYGEIRATCFADGWSKIKTLCTVGRNVKFECDGKNILKEFAVDGTVYKTNTTRKKFNRA